MAYTVENLSILTSPLDDSTSFGPVPASDTFANDGVTFFWVKAAATTGAVTLTFPNSGASSVTPPGFGPIQISIYTFNIPNSTTKQYLFGPFAPSRFNNASGQVTVQASATGVGVTAKAVRFTPIP